MDPMKMKLLMKQMGIKTKEIESEYIIIKTKDGKEIKILNPQVIEMEVKGEKTYQILGGNIEELNMEDLKIIMEQTDVDLETAKKYYLECNKDIAEAILKIQGENK
jgi:nascent polypeptide-associated complex subunit alpha